MTMPAPIKNALRYGRNAIKALDIFTNALLFAGEPGETISYHMGVRARQNHWFACRLCAALNLYQQDHCERVVKGQAANWARRADEVAKGIMPL